MKHNVTILLLTLITLFNLNTFAQKASINKIKVSYLQLPLQPLNEHIKTYKPVLEMNVTLENTDIDKLNNKYLKLHGYEKVNEGEDLLVKAEFGNFDLNKKLISDDVYNVNKGANVTGYYYELSCTYPVRLILETNDGETIYEKEIIHNEKIMHDDFGKWTYSVTELDTKFDTERKNLIDDIKNKCDQKALNEIQDIMQSRFSYYNVSAKIKLASGKGRKLDYSDLESAVLHMEKAFEMISSEASQESINAELSNALEIWKSALKESSSNNKARINEDITTMLYYNMGIAYWWMLDFTKALESLNKALEENATKSKPSSSDEKLINEVIETIKDYQNRLRIHHKI
jgi:hypothetical protein